MAFTIKEIIDLRGILFLMLLTIPSQATNLDCYGKAFHCVNSTHFMICVDLGRGISTTIDDVIIPCPSPTVCKRTNHYECEFPAPSALTSEVSTVTNTQMTDSEVTTFIPFDTTSIPFEQYFNTLSTTTLSTSEQQPLTTDSRLPVETTSTTEIPISDKSVLKETYAKPEFIKVSPESSATSNGRNLENSIATTINVILNDTKPAISTQEINTITSLLETTATNYPVFYTDKDNVAFVNSTRAVSDQALSATELFKADFSEPSLIATTTQFTSTINGQTAPTELVTNDVQQYEINTASTVVTNAVTEQTVTTEESITNIFGEFSINATDIANYISNQIVTTEAASTNELRHTSMNAISTEPSSNSTVTEQAIIVEELVAKSLQESSTNVTSNYNNDTSGVINQTKTAKEVMIDVQQPTINVASTVVNNSNTAVSELEVITENIYTNGLQEHPKIATTTEITNHVIKPTNITEDVLTDYVSEPSIEATATVTTSDLTEQTTVKGLHLEELPQFSANTTIDYNSTIATTEENFQVFSNATSPTVIYSTVTEPPVITEQLFTIDYKEPLINATITDNISDINNQPATTEIVFTNYFQPSSINTPTISTGTVTESSDITTEKLLIQDNQTKYFTVVPPKSTVPTNSDQIKSFPTDSSMLNNNIVTPLTSIDSVFNDTITVTTETVPVSNNTSYYQEFSTTTTMQDQRIAESSKLVTSTYRSEELALNVTDAGTTTPATISVLINDGSQPVSKITSGDFGNIFEMLTNSSSTTINPTFDVTTESKIQNDSEKLGYNFNAFYGNATNTLLMDQKVNTSVITTNTPELLNDEQSTTIDFALIDKKGLGTNVNADSQRQTYLKNETATQVEAMATLDALSNIATNKTDTSTIDFMNQIKNNTKTSRKQINYSILKDTLMLTTDLPSTTIGSATDISFADSLSTYSDLTGKVNQNNRNFIGTSEDKSVATPSQVIVGSNLILPVKEIITLSQTNDIPNNIPVLALSSNEKNTLKKDITNTPASDMYTFESVTFNSQSYEPNNSIVENVNKASITQRFLSDPSEVVTSILGTDSVIQSPNELSLSSDNNESRLAGLHSTQPIVTTEFYFDTTITQSTITTEPSDYFKSVNGMSTSNAVLETKGQNNSTFAPDLVQTAPSINLATTESTKHIDIMLSSKNSISNNGLNNIAEQISDTGNNLTKETNPLENILLNKMTNLAVTSQANVATMTHSDFNTHTHISKDQTVKANSLTGTDLLNRMEIKNPEINEPWQGIFNDTLNSKNESSNKNYSDFSKYPTPNITKTNENNSVEPDLNTQSLSAAYNSDVTRLVINDMTITTPNLLLLEEKESSKISNSELPSSSSYSKTESTLPTDSLASKTAIITQANTTSIVDLIEESRDTIALSIPSSHSVEPLTYSIQTTMKPSLIDQNGNFMPSTFENSDSANQLATKLIESGTSKPNADIIWKNDPSLQPEDTLSNTLFKDIIIKSSLGNEKPQKVSDSDSTSESFSTDIIASMKKSDTVASSDLNRFNVANMVEKPTIKNVDSSTSIDQLLFGGPKISDSVMNYKQDSLGQVLEKETTPTSSYNTNDKNLSGDDASVKSLIIHSLANTADSLVLATSMNTEKHVLEATTPRSGQQSETWKRKTNSDFNLNTLDKRSVNSSTEITTATSKGIEKNEKQSVPQTTASSIDLGISTEVIKGSGVLVNKNTEAVKTHSGIISFLPPLTAHRDIKEKSENRESEVGDRPKKPIRNDKEMVSNPAQKITTSPTNISITTLTHNKEVNDTNKSLELVLKSENKDFKSARSINIEELSTTKIDTIKNIENSTNTAVSKTKRKTPTHELIENSTASTNDSHTSYSKSKDQNKNSLHAHNMTGFLKDQRSVPRSLAQTNRTAVADTQPTGFPAFELSTPKTKLNELSCTNKKRGRYADGLDCRKFYICLGNSHIVEGICPVNTVFSEIRKQCTKNLSHCIRNNQFRCVTEGRFSDFLNDNMYYICVKNNISSFIRFKLLCQNGYYLNKTSVRCVLNDDSKQSNSKSDSSKNNSDQSASLTKQEETEEKKKEKKFKCKREGIFPDPSNCKRYFECTKTDSAQYRQKRKKCDSGEIFQRDKKKCVDSDSNEC